MQYVKYMKMQNQSTKKENANTDETKLCDTKILQQK